MAERLGLIIMFLLFLLKVRFSSASLQMNCLQPRLFSLVVTGASVPRTKTGSVYFQASLLSINDLSPVSQSGCARLGFDLAR
jgi:hypothetical protein